MAVECSSEFEKPLNGKAPLPGLKQTDLLIRGSSCPGEILKRQPFKLTEMPDSVFHTQDGMANETPRYQMTSLVLLIGIDHDIDKDRMATTTQILSPRPVA